MARPLRIQFPGALYHVTARGNERKAIVRDDKDRRSFRAHLGRGVSRFDWRLRAWCLMTTHYHLVVETPKPNLARGLQWLNSAYAQWFNRRHVRYGHLFGGRYAAVLVEEERHALEACRYVVLNPVRAGICADPADWPWSSYRASAGLEPPPPFLSLDWLEAEFGPDRRQAQARYRAFVADRIGTAAVRPRADVYVGSDAFVRRVAVDSGDPEIPRAQRQPLVTELAAILRRDGDLALLRAYRSGRFRIRELADAVDLHYSTVSRRLTAAERLAERET